MQIDFFSKFIYIYLTYGVLEKNKINPYHLIFKNHETLKRIPSVFGWHLMFVK
jgi:hypothetical protein